jgi:ATP-dependent Clp protease adaptor protein ClpS
MEIKLQEKPEFEEISDEAVDIGVPGKVILYNDDWHTFDEVIEQLMKATACTFETARNYAFEVHVRGKAIVFTGSINECLKVSSILEEIALHTQVVT